MGCVCYAGLTDMRKTLQQQLEHCREVTDKYLRDVAPHLGVTVIPNEWDKLRAENERLKRELKCAE